MTEIEQNSSIAILCKLPTKLKEFSSESVSTFGAQYDAFSLFIFVFYLANPLKWHFMGHILLIIAALRLGALIFWAMLVLWRFWPKNLKECLPLFWHFSLFYHLPFRTTFSTLYSSHSPSFDSFGLLGIAALAILVDEKIFCVLTILGIIFGVLVYFGFGGLTIPLIKLPTLLYAVLMVLSIMFIKLVFFRNYHVLIHEKNKAYKILAGAIAHELRRPISTLRIACEDRDNKTVMQQSNRALRIIDSILLQVKYLEKSYKIKCSQQSLRECVLKTIHDAYFSNYDRSQIIIDVPNEYAVSADRILLIQVFTNLIKNALWAFREAGEGLVQIKAQRINNQIIVSVLDNGIGISSHEQKKLFSPYFSNNKNGVGLGLAFCKLAIENMGGSIRCESEKGHHTNFLIRLPIPDKPKKETRYETTASMLVSDNHHFS